jgi:hypothetical protein
MAYAAMPSATPEELQETTASDRQRLADKLRRMTVANGCTEAEAETAMEMLWRLESPDAWEVRA